MQPVDMGIGMDDVLEFLFHQEMDLGPLYLLLETSQHRCCQDDIPDGTEPYDQESDQGKAPFNY